MHCRFNAIDSRCGMALDAIDPAQWALLEAATDEYMQQEDLRLDEMCQLLLKGLGPVPNTGLQHIRCGACLTMQESTLVTVNGSHVCSLCGGWQSVYCRVKSIWCWNA